MCTAHRGVTCNNIYSTFILVINQIDAQNLFYSKFISCLYMFRAPCAHRQGVKIVLYNLWYHHTYRWPSRAPVHGTSKNIKTFTVYLCGSLLTFSVSSGLDSTFGGLEAMITALCDEYPRLLGRHREIFVAVLLTGIYICALPTTTYVRSAQNARFSRNVLYSLCTFSHIIRKQINRAMFSVTLFRDQAAQWDSQEFFLL